MQVILLLDVDFMVSSSLNELQHSTWLQTAVSQGVLVVLPALEPVRNDAAAQQAVVRACQGMTGCWQNLVGWLLSDSTTALLAVCRPCLTASEPVKLQLAADHYL